jgi:hypothetical protein
MKSKNPKGHGAYVSSQLTTLQTLKLGDWTRDHEAECRSKTYAALALQASMDKSVGFHVTQRNMEKMCVVRFGLKQKRDNSNAHAKLLSRMAELEQKIKAVDESLRRQAHLEESIAQTDRKLKATALNLDERVRELDRRLAAAGA